MHDKCAQVCAWMRQCEPLGVYRDIVHSYEVYIYETVGIAAVTAAV